MALTEPYLLLHDTFNSYNYPALKTTSREQTTEKGLEGSGRGLLQGTTVRRAGRQTETLR